MSDHDPLDRELPGERHFALMARDPAAPSFVRAYAYWRERKFEQAYAVLRAEEPRTRSRGRAPHKDAQHAASARQIADYMDLWRIENMKGEEIGGLVSSTKAAEAPDVMRTDFSNMNAKDPGAFAEEIKNAAIRAAKPPREPEA